MARLPRATLWVWERPEDLRGLAPAKGSAARMEPATTASMTKAIAWLDQTVVLGAAVTSVPRRQPFLYPASAVRIAVVRIQALPTAPLDAIQEHETAALLLNAAARPGIAALQVDFDATRSQRTFYASLLADLRKQMPTALPLSITALASWCSGDDWIAALPVDEAVPMMFRMEPDRRRASPSALSDAPQFRIREPLCMGSVGVSTHEPWPEDIAGKRVYVFADRGWRQDLPLLNDRKLP